METAVDPNDDAKLLAFVAEEAKQDFATYIQLCDPSFIVEPFHQRIADELADVESGKCKRLIISAPPRHGKSKIIAKEWPTYLIGKNPALKFIVATHSNALAIEHSDYARGRLWHPLYQELFETRVREDASSVKHWKTAQGGEYHTAGVTVKLGGFGCDILIIDDMFADFADAHSPTKRDAVFNWFQSTAQMRLSAEGAIVIISTRWHVDDLIGRLLDPMQAARAEMYGVAEDVTWRSINFQALAHENDTLGRQPGEALSPKRWPRQKILQKQATTEDHVFAALYDGSPTILGGNYLMTQNFQIIQANQMPVNQRWMRAWDLAGSDKKLADFTAGAKGCKLADGTFIIADITRGQWRGPDMQAQIKLKSDMENIPLGAEANGPQESVVDLVQTAIKNQPIQKLYPTADKVARAGGWAVALKENKVKLFLGDWNAAFIAEAESFPRGKHDDQVDAVSYLFRMLDTGPAAQQVIRNPERDWQERPERTSRILI